MDEREGEGIGWGRARSQRGKGSKGGGGRGRGVWGRRENTEKQNQMRGRRTVMRWRNKVEEAVLDEKQVKLRDESRQRGEIILRHHLQFF